MLLIPVFLFVRYVPTWIDDSWIVLLSLVGLAMAYLVLRRAVAAMIVTVAVVAGAIGVQAPHLAADRTGDPVLLAQLSGLQESGRLDGFGDLAVAVIDLDAAQPLRLAGLGAGATTRMEVGSLTKALTGLVIADSVARGELDLDAPVETYLPQLRGVPAGDVTLRELVTHRSGYAEFGAATLRRAVWSAPMGRNWIDTGLEATMQEAASGDLAARGSFGYSTLGAATAGQAAAAAAGMSYADLMRTRLFEPLGMTDSAIQVGTSLVERGATASGLSVQPWVFDGYAPGGAAVSTVQDLGILATALLRGTAPGMDALTATAPTDQSNTGIGAFWRVSRWQTGQSIVWHNGQTAGYTSYLGLDQAHHTAVIVLSDVAVDPGTTNLGIELLARRR
jgi:CubicO group peptidase (beta-lactamase class C family)